MTHQKETEFMKKIKESIDLKGRLALFFIGFFALFFPGFVIVTAVTSMSDFFNVLEEESKDD